MTERECLRLLQSKLVDLLENQDEVIPELRELYDITVLGLGETS